MNAWTGQVTKLVSNLIVWTSVLLTINWIITNKSNLPLRPKRVAQNVTQNKHEKAWLSRVLVIKFDSYFSSMWCEVSCEGMKKEVDNEIWWHYFSVAKEQSQWQRFRVKLMHSGARDQPNFPWTGHRRSQFGFLLFCDPRARLAKIESLWVGCSANSTHTCLIVKS